ncbi:MAG: M23 family metallopeptidase [Leptospiraceae bacterium]|nr:M23 family metallopeptidase [Leptospiraceae bacterium]
MPLIPLRFVKYKVIHGDNFFKIMARTGMDIDTISSVNSLSSPQDLRVGMVLYIPNMRGIYDSEDIPGTDKGRERISKKYNVRDDLPIYDNTFGGEWFIPGRILGRIEKSFFYGMAFFPPLKEGYTSSKFGVRLDPFTKKRTFHGGVDIAAVKGTPVYSSQAGEIILAKKKGGYGRLVVIKHAMGYETRYGHLNKILVKKGQKVKKGEKVGLVGKTGRATGYHLHFEVRRFHKNQKPVFYKHL